MAKRLEDVFGIIYLMQGGEGVIIPITVSAPHGTARNLGVSVVTPNLDLPSTLATGLYYFVNFCQELNNSCGSGRIGVWWDGSRRYYLHCSLSSTHSNIQSQCGGGYK